MLPPTGIPAAPAANSLNSPFNILQSRPEAEARAAQGRFSRETWDGAIADLPNYLYDEATPRVLATPRHTAYIKIAEGCDHPCSFCIIPQLRGKFRSRRFESVVREAEQLASAGVREVTLIGQDTTSYGEDLGLRDGLALLLERMARIEKLRWGRFLYAYPNQITPRLLETIAAHPRLANYMDMPLQHASRNVLSRMKRGSSGDAFLKFLERIRSTIPGIFLRTSFIVGFPGETEADFEELCDFVRAAKFDWMGVFEYSDVDNAASFALEDKVNGDEIAARRNRLMAIQKKISQHKLRGHVGKVLLALVEGPSKDNELVWEARLEGMAPEIDGKLFLTDTETASGATAKCGDIVRVEIEKASAYDLIGRVVEICATNSRVETDSPRSAAWIEPSLPTASPVQRISTGAPLRILT